MRRLFAIGLLLLAAPARADDDPGPLLAGFEAIEAWRLDDARKLAEEAIAGYPDRGTTFALTADVKLHLADYVGALANFEEAHRRGAPVEILRDAAVAEAAKKATDGYAEAVGEHFIIRYVPGKDEILLPFAFETLDAAHARIGELLGWRPEGRVIVELYPTASTLADVSTLTPEEIANSGTIALCRWNRLMVTTPRAIVFGYSWRDTLSHELTHLIIGGASKNSVPIWLHEGIAKFAETAWRGEPGLGISVEQQQALRTAAKKGKLIPFEKMHPSMAKLKTQEETSLAFSEVFTFIEYLVEQKGWEGIRQVLTHLGAGDTEPAAIEKVYGESLTSLSRKWMKTLKTRPIKEDPRQSPGEKKLEIKSRPDVPDDQLHGVNQEGRRFARSADLLFARGRIKAAQVELQKAYDVTGSPLIGSKLAMVALAAGDLPAAEAAAKQAIKGTPDLAGPNVTLAEVLVRVGNLEAAKMPLERAIDVNPFDPRIHDLTLRVLGEKGDPTKKALATKALQILSGQIRIRPADRGTGAFIQVEGPPFQRVYLRREGQQDVLIPTALLTPTPPFEVKPGLYELELVPPTGAARREAIKVVEGSTQNAPQRIVPAGEGS